MAEVVNMHQAKSSLSRLVARALAGEEVVIARNGEFEFTEAEVTELFEGPL